MKPRIVDIARLAQVSPGTVDRVIHKRGEVSDQTRQKVLDILKELDYQPDILAKSLATKRKLNLFLIIPVSANENDFWSAPLNGVEQAIKEIQHYGVQLTKLFFDQYDSDSFLEQSQKVLSEKPDGLILAPVFAKESELFVHQLKEQNIPVILINSNLDNLNDTCFIGQDSIQSGFLAAKLFTYGLNGGGHLLIANITARKDDYNHILSRERGFRKYFAENPQENLSISTIELMQTTDIEMERKFDVEFDHKKIISVFVTNSRVFHVAKYLQKHDIHNVRLIGYDLLPDNVQYLKDGLIDFLISQRPEEQGYTAITTLFNKIFLNKEVQRKHYMPIDIITKENLDYYKFR
ncbi:MAG: LacI family DNA-binding transcriptional regulator [Bacteroidales bacterium]|nr:LacI family DNA-binding transcriptional regulator [Bacteroidales bacterium]